jgi:hypothetical protein
LSWDTPQRVSDIHSLLGLARYYRRFTEGFFNITKPLTYHNSSSIREG